MKNDLKLLLIIITTLALMFATSLLLDITLVKQQFIRKAIIYLLIAIQAFIGFVVLRSQLKQ